MDATSKLKTLVSKGETKASIEDLTIDVILNAEEGTLTIKDQGIGMNESEVKKILESSCIFKCGRLH